LGHYPKERLQVAPGKKSYITLSRIQALESMDLNGVYHRLGRPFEELADYRNINGHCMFLQQQRKRRWLIGSKGKGVNKLHLAGKESYITPPVSRH
jgi:hypothetical protein